MSVRLIIQMDEKLRQKSDLERMVRCNLPNQMMEMNIGEVTDEKKGVRYGDLFMPLNYIYVQWALKQAPLTIDRSFHQIRQGRMHFNRIPELDEAAPRIRVWLELGGSDGSGIVEVGQMTTITVRAILPANVGLRIVDCSALDGLGESSQKLLDDRGCPVDEQVN